ncbi:MAG TPA: PIN domain-containing protein [Polyangiaceae bacterium]|jgi:predicted nucleic acid-binding protein|nr:PIN domain-containing protein [Polyangiaceae bacterium]
MLSYVFDTGALIAAERGKERASRFLRMVRSGRARILVPLPVVAEWWRGRTDAREEILAASRVVATVEIAQAAGVALARAKNAHAGLTIDAIVMATAALLDAIVVTGDPQDFERLSVHFPGVSVLAV